MPFFPDLDQPLTAPGVTVRLATEWDIPEILIAHQDDPLLHRRLGLHRPPSGAELGRRTEHSDQERASGANIWLTVLAPGSKECRGQIDVHAVDWDHRRAELSIWVAPRDRGRGLATGALSLTGRWLLKAGGLQRVDLIAEPDNEPMLRAAVAAGFTREGVLRGYLREPGGRIDVVVMSLIDRDLERR
jgi:RimJ/RimL family protein N-acetyltransferase